MDIADYQKAVNIDPVMNEIDNYNLYKHIVELEAYGLTVVPPETLGVNEDFINRLRSGIN